MKEGKAILKKPNGDKYNLVFVCAACQKTTIWTNEFKLMIVSEVMICAYCGCRIFFIQGVRK